VPARSAQGELPYHEILPYMVITQATY